jgi:hypothetical protein
MTKLKIQSLLNTLKHNFHFFQEPLDIKTIGSTWLNFCPFCMGHMTRKLRRSASLKNNWTFFLLKFPFYVPVGLGCQQGVTKRCRLSLLTNSALLYEPK